MLKIFMRYGPLGIVAYVLTGIFWFFVSLYLLLKIWPVAITALVLVVTVVVWRHRRKRHKHG